MTKQSLNRAELAKNDGLFFGPADLSQLRQQPLKFGRSLSVIPQRFRAKFVQAMTPRVHAYQTKVMQQSQMVLERCHAARIEPSSEQLYRLSIKHSLAGRQRQATAPLYDYFFRQVLSNVLLCTTQYLRGNFSTELFDPCHFLLGLGFNWLPVVTSKIVESP